MSNNSAAGFLLLKDGIGHGYENTLKQTFKKIFGTPHSTVRVLRGELVKEYHEQDTKYNYVLHRDPSIFLICKDENVAPLIMREEFLLMEGIEKPGDRFLAFTEGLLELGLGLTPGCKVYVKVFSSGYTRELRATLHFVGEVKGMQGIQFGVEIAEKKFGTNDGTHNGHRYFECQNGYGLFVSLDKLKKYSGEPRVGVASRVLQGNDKETNEVHINQVDSIANNTRSKSKPDGQASGCSKGDRVFFFDKKGDRIEGVVQWAGNSSISRTFNFRVVGIQTDVEVFNIDVENSIPGLGHLISAPKQKSLFLPEQFVERIESNVDNLDIVITPSLAKELNCPIDKLVSEQEKCLNEVQERKLEDELKKAGTLSEEECAKQGEILKKIKEENMQRKKEDIHNLREQPDHTDNTDRHRAIHQSKSYDNHKMEELYGQHQNVHENLHSGRDMETQFSDVSPNGTSVDRNYGDTRASTGHSPCQEVTKGSAIQIPNANSDGSIYGVVRWIGTMPNVNGLVAGIELDEPMDGCTDGTWKGQNQTLKFFNCSEGKGLYYPLNGLQPDQRVSRGVAAYKNPLGHVADAVYELRVTVDTDIRRYIGEEKGIQGHQNSCYLDATIFGLFALSHEFDDMFLRNRETRVGKLLWQKIVNPLRKYGVVKYESVMELRSELEQLGKMTGITHAEKDPEEFLNFMFKHSLKIKPFISIRRPFGVEPEYFVQLFMEFSESAKPGCIGSLLTGMFKEQSISFTQIPSKLLIQVPRHGKKFQSFQKIIPEKTINVSEVTDSVCTGPCFFCGDKEAAVMCDDCYSEFGGKNRMAYCHSCYQLSHTSKRTDHKKVVGEKGSSTLELLSILCIETSHYVCFTRSGNRWLFFDSMFDRQYDLYNIPRVQDCSDDLNKWVYPPDNNIDKLIQTKSRDLPECVRRFTQDIYLCVYVQQDFSMY